jgi:hypothetical protein
MRRKRVPLQRIFDGASENALLPPLEPYRRCSCGICRACRDNEKWDRVFAKFETKDYGDIQGWFRSPLSDL